MGACSSKRIPRLQMHLLRQVPFQGLGGLNWDPPPADTPVFREACKCVRIWKRVEAIIKVMYASSFSRPLLCGQQRSGNFMSTVPVVIELRQPF